MVDRDKKFGDLSNDSDRRDHQLETLYRISHIMAAGRGQRQVLAEVLDTLDSELGMKRGTITLLSPSGTELMREDAHNVSQD